MGRAQAFVADAQTIGSERAEQGGGRQRLRVQPAGAAGRTGRLPIQMVISTTSGFQAVFEQMEKLKKAARKRILHRG
jgi:hypothetical protein